MEIIDGEVEYTLEDEQGKQEIFKVEKALVSIGRVPNTINLGLENLKINLGPRGHIIDENTRTNIPNIYAVGDLTSHMALVNVAELEGRHAIEQMYDKPEPLSYKNISSLFLDPEVATVGMNEQQARSKDLDYRLVKLDYSTVARLLPCGKQRALLKYVTDDDEMRILGMRALGAHASSIIQAVALLISMNKGIDALVNLIHPHPSIIEGVQKVVRMLRETQSLSQLFLMTSSNVIDLVMEKLPA